MDNLELRPLSIGEILDRTFSLYRKNFVLFIALSAIPRLPALALNLLLIQWSTIGLGGIGAVAGAGPAVWGLIALTYIASIVGYIFSQGGSVIAVSDLYLGRSISIMDALRRVAADIGPLLGVMFLSGLAITVGFVLLIIPGIYLMLRLFVCVPAAVIEGRGPAESLSRSMALTKGFAGRAFVILLLYVVVSLGFSAVATGPLAVAVAVGTSDLSTLRLWTSIQALVTTFFQVLLTPILLIATSIYYYDLRVRKEAFDLQMMMDPDGANMPRPSMRSILPEGQ